MPQKPRQDKPQRNQRRSDQSGPERFSPTGIGEPGSSSGPDPRSQGGDVLTTAVGVRLSDTDHSLKAGLRGPSLLEDHHLREKIMHFDHQRIPERVVHARGAGAHGVFRSYGTATRATKAGVLSEGRETPVFVRFSTVLGSRGAADTARDVRGFAVKFYTEEGNWDLVGNNMPIFFIQDGIKFPDLIHAAKPHPDREIPQAATAHDTFWDFVSVHTEAMHQVIWAMSDRGLPRSYRMMEGFGIHTFRLVDAKGATTLAKFHWKPVAGVHSMVWEEAQLAAGIDPDFHRRDLADAIEAGAYPEWELGVQLLADTEDETFEGIDLLDPTKLVPEELAPVQPVGRLTLNRNPVNFFAETEQVAFCTSHVVPGIQFTNDPLLQARNFSYLDTQLTRLGGPNFNQLPINRPHAPVNDNLRDGMHQSAVHAGVTPYLPNGLDRDRPLRVGDAEGGYVTLPTPVSGDKVRGKPASFDDHFSQATLFWVSLTPVEQDHIVAAYTFELGKCYEQPIRERMLVNLAHIDGELCARVATGLGLPAPDGKPATDITPSPALSQISETPGPVPGRVVGVVAGPDSDLAGIGRLRKALDAEGAVLRVVAATGGVLGTGKNQQTVERTLLTTRSVEYDAVLIAGGTAGMRDARLTVLLQEAFRHCKLLGAWGDGADVLEAAAVAVEAPGVLVAATVDSAYATALIQALGLHRVWARAELLTAGSTP
ncbi:MAG: catalase [Mycobacteriales bacterium]